MNCMKCKYEALLTDLGYSWGASYDGGYYEGPVTVTTPEEQTIVVWV